MALILQSHGGPTEKRQATSRSGTFTEALVPADGDIAVDEAADFGYLLPPTEDEDAYLDPDSVDHLDTLGTLMVPDSPDVDATTDGQMPAVMTYWGQFLDHELTARTDRETELSDIKDPRPKRTGAEIERLLKNARTPRFDLDSVYGGVPVGVFESAEMQRNAAIVSAGMRHPTLTNKMRVGTAVEPGPLPDDTIDEHRDLPRFGQVEQKVRDAMLAIARARITDDDKFAEFEASLPKRALIGDMRNDENLIVAQFHLSVLRFHNKAVDFLAENDTGWIPDFAAAKTLTTLHYQWLAVEGYLRGVCDGAVVDRVLDTRARHFFRFRADYAERNATRGLGDAMPLEFSVAAYRFGHSMVRNIYDYNRTFGRPNGRAPFDQIFAFTGGGGLGKNLLNVDVPALPKNWVIDWSRFVHLDTSFDDGEPHRASRAVDTQLAPPLGDMVNEGSDFADDPSKQHLFELFRHLARRNLRRGLSMRLPTGQALHAHLKSIGAVTSDPIQDISSKLSGNQPLKDFLQGEGADLNTGTPLWFYCLAEAEGSPGEGLGELGSWIVASTFVGVLLDDPESALSRDFSPAQSPLRMADGSPVDTIEKWMRFAHVLA